MHVHARVVALLADAVEMLEPAGEVEAGAERVAVAFEHDDAHFRIAVRLLEVQPQGVEHLGAQRVELVRPVQRDRGDAIRLLVEDDVFGHGVRSFPQPLRRVGHAFGCRSVRGA